MQLCITVAHTIVNMLYVYFTTAEHAKRDSQVIETFGGLLALKFSIHLYTLESRTTVF